MRLPGPYPQPPPPDALHTEAGHVPTGRWVRDLVFGANDGLVAAFAVVSGVHGAEVSTRIVLLAGLAELLGGTIAMGLGAFLAVKSEREFVGSERTREEREVIEFPETERSEVKAIFARKGYKGAALDTIVEHITSDPKFWVDTMMTEELGLTAEPAGEPLRSGIATGGAYALGAAMPVLPYALPIPASTAFALSVALTLLSLFSAGAAKTALTGRPWLRSGLESAAIGALAASATFAAGRLIAGV